MNLQGDLLLVILCIISTLLRYCSAFGWHDYGYSIFSKVPTSSRHETIDTEYRKQASIWPKYHFWRRRRGLENENTPLMPSVSKLYTAPVKRYFHFSPYFLKSTVQNLDQDISRKKQNQRTDKKTKSVNTYNSVAELWKVFRPDQYSDNEELYSKSKDNSKESILDEKFIDSRNDDNDNERNVYPDDLITSQKLSETVKDLLRPHDNQQKERKQVNNFENNAYESATKTTKHNNNVVDDTSSEDNFLSGLVGKFESDKVISVEGAISNIPDLLEKEKEVGETKNYPPLDPIHQRAVGTPLGVGSHIDSPDGLYDPGYEPIKTKLFVPEDQTSTDLTGFGDYGGSDYDYGFDDSSYGFFPDAEFGLGSFDDDESGCEGIETRRCTIDSECSCFGMFFCIQGSCQMKGATPPEDPADQLGTWLEEPITDF